MSNTKEYDVRTRKIIDPDRRKALMLLSDESDSDVLVPVLREKRFRLLGMTSDLTQGLELMRKHKVGIVFLDEDMESLELEVILNQIKSKHPGFSVIMLGAQVTKEKIEFAFAHVAVAYLVKPLRPEAVIKSMSKFSLS